jgi:hypothetical protein
MRRVAFLLGAGATKGAGGIQPEPPLGSELYECLRSSFPESWGSLITDVEDAAFRADPPFEPGMALLWETREQRVQRLIIDMALYFADFAPPDDGSDLYSRLLAALARMGLLGRSVFATLNYDCTLEISAANKRIPVRYPGTVGAAPGLPVLKPHGSCNFLVQGTQNFIDVSMAGMGAGYVGGSPSIEVVPPSSLRPLYGRIGISLPPVISLYAPGKPSPVAESFVAATRQLWAGAVREADVVVVIGARPLGADDHIWTPLLMSRADVWYVGGQDGGDYELLERRLQRRLSPLGRRFDESFGRLTARLKILS